jgi:hypothetical protein
MRRAATGLALLLLTGVLASCAQLGPTIPVAGPGVGASSSAAGGALANATGPAVPQVSAKAKAATADLGVQIYWHEVTDAYVVKANADRLFDYAVSLGANSVGISFPIYTDGARPTKVYTRDGVTPTPDSLQTVIGEAKARGLRVMIRPLIDEANIKDGAGSWRGSIKPRSTTAWFASYQSALLPFLRAAAAGHADTFVIGAELESLVSQRAQWQALETAASAVFGGKLAFADNWSQWATGRPGVPGTEAGLDAYPQLHLLDSATVPEIAAAWRTWLQKRPSVLADTVVQEIGISATPGGYKEPAVWGSTGATLAPQIQANWFAGACEAVRSLGMPGIYYWNLDAWAEPAKAATYDSGSFIGRGDSAIKTCFASGWPGQ